MYTDIVKNVTISLDERLLERARERARTLGQSLNDYARSLFEEDVDGANHSRAQASFDYADRLGKRSTGPYLTREEANERT